MESDVSLAENESASSPHLSSYRLSIWAECDPQNHVVWRGCLETLAGQRLCFEALAELNWLLCEFGGWMDPLPQSHGRETPYESELPEQGIQNVY